MIKRWYLLEYDAMIKKSAYFEWLKSSFQGIKEGPFLLLKGQQLEWLLPMFRLNFII